MRTAVSAPNKASEDVKPGGQAHTTGTGHHMKTVAKKCKDFICLQNIHNLLFFSGIEQKLAGKNKILSNFNLKLDYCGVFFPIQ